jgi:glucose/arabinose dehydrogenase
MKWSTIVCVGALIASGCAHAGAQVFHSSAGDLALQTMASGLDHPRALAFLPDGRILVTERPGRMCRE